MAKQPTAKSGTARIRFVMLDAEIPEGDLTQITAAIQNALKPTSTIIQQRVIAPALTNGAAPERENEAEALESEIEDVQVAQPQSAPKSSKPRKPTVPKVLELDLTSGVSFESYAAQHSPESEPDRNLVVAAWFKEHRGLDAITAGHVYTCYRQVKWSVGIEDFSWPLRGLKKDQLMSSAGRGEYAINHLGLDRVHKMAIG